MVLILFVFDFLALPGLIALRGLFPSYLNPYVIDNYFNLRTSTNTSPWNYFPCRPW